MSYNCIFDVLKSCEVDNNFDDILNYIISKNTHDFEKEYMAKIDKFEQLYNRLYKEQKKQYYLSNNIYNSCKSKGYILIAEYYNPTPVSVNYRGNKNVLFKRDFAGEILKTYSKKIELVDYGFTYHRDKHPQGDITWFLLQKK